MTKPKEYRFNLDGSEADIDDLVDYIETGEWRSSDPVDIDRMVGHAYSALFTLRSINMMPLSVVVEYEGEC